MSCIPVYVDVLFVEYYVMYTAVIAEVIKDGPALFIIFCDGNVSV